MMNTVTVSVILVVGLAVIIVIATVIRRLLGLVPLEPLSPTEEETSLRNVEHCVVALAETWEDTAGRIVDHWFPWMSF